MALTRFTGPERVTRAALGVDADALADVEDPEAEERYAAEASRMAAGHDPGDAL